MSLKNIIAFGTKKIEIMVSRSGNKININVVADGKQVKSLLTDHGAKIDIKL